MKKQQFTEVGPLTAGLTDQIFIVKNENDERQSNPGPNDEVDRKAQESIDQGESS